MTLAIAPTPQRRATGRNGPRALMLLPMLSFLVFLAFGGFVLSKFNEDARAVEAAQTSVVAAAFASSVERVLSRALTATRSLAVMVYQGQGRVEDFERLALFLLPMYKAPMPCPWHPTASSGRSNPWTATCWSGTTMCWKATTVSR